MSWSIAPDVPETVMSHLQTIREVTRARDSGDVHCMCAYVCVVAMTSFLKSLKKKNPLAKTLFKSEALESSRYASPV